MEANCGHSEKTGSGWVGTSLDPQKQQRIAAWMQEIQELMILSTIYEANSAAMALFALCV